jgi:phosphoribosylaminoimidazolecarboxamide formyltransferase/IMP cyclohydrolase
VVELARALLTHGVQILSTGGTAQLLKLNGVVVTEVAEHTGFPEMMEGRVKTLHPKVHGGILARRDSPSHLQSMREHDIPPIDMVVVNLYPFAQTVAKPGCTLEDAIENIDIGGPAMVRAAAKNHEFVAVVTDPADYASIIAKLASGKGKLDFAERFRLAAKAFSHTAEYDGMISNWLTARSPDGVAREFPDRLNLQVRLAQALRYGENPHQPAAFYVDRDPPPGTLANFRQLQGKELSYNNILDLDAAMRLCAEFALPAAAIIKHNNPCGAAVAEAGVAEAYRRARETDPVSAFGGIVAVNRQVDAALAREMSETFLECVIAPSYAPEALQTLAAKKNLRLLAYDFVNSFAGDAADAVEVRSVTGGLLVQTRDTATSTAAAAKVVSKRAPTPQELADLDFAWRVCKHVKSNAIVFAGGGRTIGIGAGQMSRVDSVRIAVSKARAPLKGTVVASDAFFPFRDGVDESAKAGAVAVIEPGGSVRDDEAIASADEHGLALVFTGERHFRH